MPSQEVIHLGLSRAIDARTLLALLSVGWPGAALYVAICALMACAAIDHWRRAWKA